MAPWHPNCQRCDRQCTKSTTQGLQVCSWGVNFQRVTSDLLIAGVIAEDFPAPTTAWRKARQLSSGYRVRRDDIQRVADRALEATAEQEAEARRARERVIEEYRASGAYQRELAEQLRPEFRQVLAQVHDYRQFVQRVLQNLDVILERGTPGLPLEEKVEQASQHEQAIYWAARLMDEKLDAALFYLEPERISVGRVRFRLHGAVTKIKKIYEPHVADSGLRLVVAGETWAYVEGNPAAFSGIPHALIDNAVKYAPAGTTIRLTYAETTDQVTFAVESEGPLIADDERTKIFDPFVRGAAARQVQPGGMGFGLAQAQLIAGEMETKIEFTQNSTKTKNGTYATKFFVRFPKVDPPASAKREDAQLRRRLEANG